MARVVSSLTAIALLILVCSMISCSQSGSQTEEVNKYGTKTVWGNGPFKAYVIIVDGCEYIRYDAAMTHKGNCKNPIHKYNEH